MLYHIDESQEFWDDGGMKTRSIKEKVFQYTAMFESAEEGGYTVTIPFLPGCISEGDTFEEALENVEEAIQSYLASVLKHGDEIPTEDEKPFVGTITVRSNKILA